MDVKVGNIQVVLSELPLNAGECQAFVELPEAGGVVVFIGTVRAFTQGKRVQYLEFEAYEPMAIKEMQRIAAQALEKFAIHRISMHHRTGKLLVGEIPVVIAVSASHRQAAFQACSYCIDTLKETVPIWKKEVFDDGNVWVAAHP